MQKLFSSKRVHFSDSCLAFDPITSAAPPFPSPSSSSSSDSPPPLNHHRTPSPSSSDDQSSDPDPPTPPPVQYIPSPYPYAPASLNMGIAASSISTPFSPSSTPMPTGGLTIGLPTPTPSPPHSHILTIPTPRHSHYSHHHHHHHHHHPQYSHLRSLHPSTPNPPLHMNVHHLLAYSPSTVSPLLFNLSTLPNVQTLSTLAKRPIFELDEPATNPPLEKMILTCADLPEDWKVTVTPTPPSRRTELALTGAAGLFSPASSVFSPQLGLLSPDLAGAGGAAVGSGGLGYVTVLDVLLALYISLRMIVHPSEYENLTRPPSGHTKESVNAAFWARVAQVGDPAKKEEQRRKGVRRIDFMGNKTRLLGLTGTLKSEVWELELSEVPVPVPAKMRSTSSSSSSGSAS